jgi:hypothetical protein
MTMIVMWLIELYLNQLNQLKESADSTSSEHKKIQEEFRKFLANSSVKVHLFSDTIICQ